jgi:hypothetical protein
MLEKPKRNLYLRPQDHPEGPAAIQPPPKVEKALIKVEAAEGEDR